MGYRRKIRLFVLEVDRDEKIVTIHLDNLLLLILAAVLIVLFHCYFDELVRVR